MEKATEQNCKNTILYSFWQEATRPKVQISVWPSLGKTRMGSGIKEKDEEFVDGWNNGNGSEVLTGKWEREGRTRREREGEKNCCHKSSN